MSKRIALKTVIKVDLTDPLDEKKETKEVRDAIMRYFRAIRFELHHPKGVAKVTSVVEVNR